MPMNHLIERFRRHVEASVKRDEWHGEPSIYSGRVMTRQACRSS
jgi:hypothetical protein